MEKFKIGYFADGPWSHRAFEYLKNDATIDILFIVPRIGTTDYTLREFSEEYKIDYLHSEKINSENFFNKVKEYECDLFISMSFDQIFRKRIINLPKFGTINCHAGKLPFYRGRNILNWVLINDEKEFGITVHFVDEGIDTGDIILQKTFPITDNDDYNTLLCIAYEQCANILYDATKQIQTGTFQRITQSTIHSVGLFCGRRQEGDEIINWNSKSRDIFNFIRALSKPGPVATSILKGSAVNINRSKMIAEAPNYINTPGQLLAKTKEGFLVKTSDTFIEILEIESEIKIQVGDRFEI